MKEEQKVYIRGDEKRSREVIKTLEDLGGINYNNLNGVYEDAYYYISPLGKIEFADSFESILLSFIKEFYKEIKLPLKKTFNDIKIGDTIYVYDYEFKHGFKMKVTDIKRVTDYNNDAYTWFICKRDTDKKDYGVFIENKEIEKTSWKSRNLKMIYFVNEKDYNNKIY